MPIIITVDQRAIDGAIQVAIGDGNSGYRIAGPKYDGRGLTLLKKVLDERDVAEIRSYLRKVKKVASS